MAHLTNIRLYLLLNLILIVAIDKLPHFVPLSPHPKSRNVFHLNVAILSAREHFDKRKAIRESWFKHIDLLNQLATTHELTFNIDAHFVIGSQACLIHPIDREDLYDCIPRNVFPSNLTTFDENEFQPIFILEKHDSTLNYNRDFFKGFSFKTFHALTIRKIGAFSSLFNQSQQIDISILDAFSKKKIFNISITKENILDDNFYFANTQFEIASDATCIIIIDQDIILDGTKSLPKMQFNQVDSLLKIERSYYGSNDYESEIFDSNEDFFMINFLFTAKDLFKQQQNVDYSKSWFQKMRTLDHKLNEEALASNDIIFVDLIDVYRNLPEKLLRYYQKLSNSSAGITHILKTDDDCYVNIFRVVELLLQNYNDKFTWFGNFRRKWPVNYYGKWADQAYSSPTYPQFACGSGYIITRDLADWLSMNSDYLRRYQGEDVSMGIWMSSIAHKIVQDKRWLCGEEAHINWQHFLSAPQFTPEAMLRTYTLWNELLERPKE